MADRGGYRPRSGYGDTRLGPAQHVSDRDRFWSQIYCGFLPRESEGPLTSKRPRLPYVPGEFLYIRQDIKVELQPVGMGGTQTLFDMAVGRRRTAQVGRRHHAAFRGFGRGGHPLGAEGRQRNSEWRFSTSFGAGIKVFPSERIGFRFERRFLLPFGARASRLAAAHPEAATAASGIRHNTSRQCECGPYPGLLVYLGSRLQHS